ncbi:RNA polymerase sigma-70 factor [Chitinophaga agrisoli]|uniref:RNA polymerase sigma-70 factor n=1 Tax=Chitinophaga agrisoli TaxID=2607653 RepID=A0A5B2VZ81_9BACT|nr:RNA polymerase sigma-70 factor [Chitinophaga agrisoli]KAA2245133.1 RNA polymerase sigma-70 factor [Chitinophaga agrisoli]
MAGNIPIDEVFFTELFRQYAARIFHYFKKYVKQDHIAEDLMQELFANMWARRAFIKEDKNPEAYLFVSARNHLYNHLQKTLKTGRVITLQEVNPETTYSQAEEPIYYNAAYQEYRTVLNFMSPQRKKAFELSREYGLSYREIADTMGISIKTVESHIAAVLQVLRRKIGHLLLLAFLLLIR